MKKIFSLLIAVFTVFILTGCSLEDLTTTTTAPAEEITTAVDSSDRTTTDGEVVVTTTDGEVVVTTTEGEKVVTTTEEPVVVTTTEEVVDESLTTVQKVLKYLDESLKKADSTAASVVFKKDINLVANATGSILDEYKTLAETYEAPTSFGYEASIKLHLEVSCDVNTLAYDLSSIASGSIETAADIQCALEVALSIDEVSVDLGDEMSKAIIAGILGEGEDQIKLVKFDVFFRQGKLYFAINEDLRNLIFNLIDFGSNMYSMTQVEDTTDDADSTETVASEDAEETEVVDDADDTEETSDEVFDMAATFAQAKAILSSFLPEGKDYYVFSFDLVGYLEGEYDTEVASSEDGGETAEATGETDETEGSTEEESQDLTAKEIKAELAKYYDLAKGYLLGMNISKAYTTIIRPAIVSSGLVNEDYTLNEEKVNELIAQMTSSFDSETVQVPAEAQYVLDEVKEYEPMVKALVELFASKLTFENKDNKEFSFKGEEIDLLGEDFAKAVLDNLPAEEEAKESDVATDGTASDDTTSEDEEEDSEGVVNFDELKISVIEGLLNLDDEYLFKDASFHLEASVSLNTQYGIILNEDEVETSDAEAVEAVVALEVNGSVIYHDQVELIIPENVLSFTGTVLFSEIVTDENTMDLTAMVAPFLDMGLEYGVNFLSNLDFEAIASQYLPE
ncbi:MAG: hypothetical protein K6G38_03310 [Gammaproteobacteria bacterium]|nr:hypothetical protein [Gammaproteobacteria bacterium]